MLIISKRINNFIYLFTYLLHNGPVTFFFEQAEIVKMEAKRKQVCIFLILKRLVQKKRPETK